MNTAKFEKRKNIVVLCGHENIVQAKLIRVKSDYVFIQPTQVIDNPKERDCK